MAARRTNKLVSLIVLVIVIVIIAIIGFVAYFTNGFSKDLETFYVEYDGAKISSDGLNGLYLPSGSVAEFNVKYVIPGQSGYRVSVVPNADNDFTFTVGGIYKDWREIGDITYNFSIDKQAEKFILFAPNSFTIAEFVKALFPGEEVIIDELPDSQKDYFIMTIQSADGAQSVNVGFRISTGVSSVTLDKGEIAF